jgi:hypothetical protein
MVTAAALAGLELLALQKEFKKSASGCGWLDLLSNRQEEFGFAERTAQKYMRLAQALKSKLLKAEDGRVLALLDKAPSAMSDKEGTILCEAVRKSVDGESLSGLYEELGITRKQHKAPDRGTLKNAGDGKAPPMHVPLEQQAQEQLEFFAKFTIEMEKKIKLGKEEVLLLTQQPEDQIEKLIAIHEHNLAVLRQVKKARRGK